MALIMHKMYIFLLLSSLMTRPLAQKKELDIVRNALTVLEKGTTLVTPGMGLPGLKGAVAGLSGGKIGIVFGVLASIFGLATSILTDKRFTVLLEQMQKIQHGIMLIQQQLREFELKFKWEITKLQVDISVPKLAVEYMMARGQNRNDSETVNIYNRWLSELCAHRRCETELDDLYESISGKSYLKNPVFDAYYRVTRGNRPLISALCAELMPVLFFGTTAVLLNERLNGLGENASYILSVKYEKKWNETMAEIDSILDRVVAEFEQNLRQDVNDILANQTELSNIELSKKIWLHCSQKYDWQRLAVILYQNDKDEGISDGDAVKGYVKKKQYVVFYADVALRDIQPVNDGEIPSQCQKSFCESCSGQQRTEFIRCLIQVCLENGETKLINKKYCIYTSLHKRKIDFSGILVLPRKKDSWLTVGKNMEDSVVSAKSSNAVAFVLINQVDVGNTTDKVRLTPFPVGGAAGLAFTHPVTTLMLTVFLMLFRAI